MNGKEIDHQDYISVPTDKFKDATAGWQTKIETEQKQSCLTTGLQNRPRLGAPNVALMSDDDNCCLPEGRLGLCQTK